MIKQRIIKLIHNCAQNFGFVALPKSYIDHYALAKRIKRIIEEYEIDCVIDVGANVGQYLKFLRERVEYSGLVISIEPDPECFEILSGKGKSDKKFFALNFALGPEECTKDFNIMRRKVFNSFLDPDDAHTQRFSEGNQVENVIPVDMRRLDTLVSELRADKGVSKIFLKLDTQGFDLSVMEGVGDYLDLIQGVQTEISITPIYKGMPSFGDTMKNFEDRGFSVSGLYSLSESRFPHAIEYDCIYLKS